MINFYQVKQSFTLKRMGGGSLIIRFLLLYKMYLTLSSCQFPLPLIETLYISLPESLSPLPFQHLHPFNLFISLCSPSPYRIKVQPYMPINGHICLSAHYGSSFWVAPNTFHLPLTLFDENISSKQIEHIKM